jgi:hypothetical protein
VYFFAMQKPKKPPGTSIPGSFKTVFFIVKKLSGTGDL